MIVTLDLDDYSPMNNHMGLLEKLREKYNGFKVTLFTVPWEIRWKGKGKGTPITDKMYAPFVEATKQAVADGWMEIAIHGLTHHPREFENLSYDMAKKRVMIAQKMFENVGIKTCDLFKAPQWLISAEAIPAVIDCGMRLVEDHYYNWNIMKEMPDEQKLIAHGHIQDDPAWPNGLEQSFFRLTKIPTNADWKFLSEVL